MQNESARASGGAGTSRSAGLLTIDLGVSLKAAWKAHCSAAGLRPSSAVVGLVKTSLGDAGGSVAAPPPSRPFTAQVARRPDEAPRRERRFTFTASEDRAIGRAAMCAGLSYQAWVIAATRAQLIQMPAFGQAELEALTVSSRTLAGLVIELAAWRREGAAGGEPAVQARLAVLEGAVRRHVELVGATLAQSTRRWEVRL